MIYKERLITMLQKWKYDLMVIGCLCITVLLFWGLPCILTSTGEAYVTIYRDGEVYFTGALSEDNSISVTDSYGNYNLILIDNNTVKMSDAQCPDKLCIKHGSISKNGESIICLPNKVVVQITSEEESDLDAVTN